MRIYTRIFVSILFLFSFMPFISAYAASPLDAANKDYAFAFKYWSESYHGAAGYAQIAKDLELNPMPAYIADVVVKFNEFMNAWTALGYTPRDLQDAMNDGTVIDWNDILDQYRNPGWRTPSSGGPSIPNPGVGLDGSDLDGSYNFIDVTAMLSALKTQIPQLIRFVVALSYVCGLAFVIIAVLKLKAYGQQTVMSSSHANFTPSMIYLVIGMVLLYYPTMFDVGTATLMSSGGDSLLSYDNYLPGLGYSELVAIVIAIVRLVGYIAFLKGWIILSRLAGHAQPGTISKGIVHIIGGVLAANIVTTWQIFRETLGYVW